MADKEWDTLYGATRRKAASTFFYLYGDDTAYWTDYRVKVKHAHLDRSTCW